MFPPKNVFSRKKIHPKICGPNFFDWKMFRPKYFSAASFFRPKTFRQKNFRSNLFFDRKCFRPKSFLTENFAVRIAEGGSNGGVRGVREPPPVRPSRGFCGASITDPALLVTCELLGVLSQNIETRHERVRNHFKTDEKTSDNNDFPKKSALSGVLHN